jgi:hypothetical protein
MIEGNLDERYNDNFSTDIAIAKGPSPGAITVSDTGTDVDFSELTLPGLCRIKNLDEDEIVTYGIWDGAVMFALGEVLPGEAYVIRLSRFLGEELTGSGTASGGSGNTLRFMSEEGNDASVNVFVGAFDA